MIINATSNTGEDSNLLNESVLPQNVLDLTSLFLLHALSLALGNDSAPSLE